MTRTAAATLALAVATLLLALSGVSAIDLRDRVTSPGALWGVCTGATGTCVDVNRHPCSGPVLSNKCGGGQNRKCCPAPLGVHDSRCAAMGGTCMHSSACSGGGVSGKCPGPSHIRCCVSGGSSSTGGRQQNTGTRPTQTNTPSNTHGRTAEGDGSDDKTINDGDSADSTAAPTTTTTATGGAYRVNTCPHLTTPENILRTPKGNPRQTPSIAYDREQGNPYRVVRDNYGNLPQNSKLRVSVPTTSNSHLHCLCANRFLALREAGLQAGYDFKVQSGWRLHRFQNSMEVYRRIMTERYGALGDREFRKRVAFKSPHETGLALDLGSPSPFTPSFSQKNNQLRSPAFAWLKANAHRFGITPYKHEPWHWECVIARESFASGKELWELYPGRFQADISLRVYE